MDATRPPGTSFGQQMKVSPPDDPCVMVLFGAGGDLATRRLVPALYNLACEKLLPPRFAFIGVGQQQMTEIEYRNRLGAQIEAFNTRPQFDRRVWEDLAGRFNYLSGPVADVGTFTRLANLVAGLDARENLGGNVISYLAVAPSLCPAISARLHGAGFNERAKGWTRLVIERPVGGDLVAAVRLNRALLDYWSEDQIYSIDQYLGNEAAWGVLDFRFGEGLFEPLWSREHIDHIQFTMFDSNTVQTRSPYFDKSGVLGDMAQILAFFCMERPASFSAEAIRHERVKLMQSVRRLTPADVARNTVRGQYVGYREESGVDQRSSTETFAALRLFIDNLRWRDVPIYLRSAKATSVRATYAVVQFKTAPSTQFHKPGVAELTGDRLVFPFSGKGAFPLLRGTGYERLILSCMKGDQTPFMPADLVEATSRLVQPIQEAWSSPAAADSLEYSVGTSGPAEASDLLNRDGRAWYEIDDT